MKKVINIILFLCFCVFQNGYSETIIQMEEDGGVYKVPCTVNGLKMKFIFDTGASTVSISWATAKFMLDNDYLSYEDFKDKTKIEIADGNVIDGFVVNLKKIEFGGVELKNIKATVSKSQNAPLLLGQTVIHKLGPVTISGKQLTINTDNYRRDTPKTGYKREWTFEEMLKLANDSNVEAMDSLAIHYMRIKEYKKAREWLELAALQNDAFAEFLLGEAYLLGKHIKVDKKKGLNFLENASLHGNFDAKLRLGVELLLGNNINKNYERSFRLLSECNNHPEKLDMEQNTICNHFIGICYFYGYGTYKDSETAVIFWEKAAKNGHPYSQYNLGNCYYYGDGVFQNYTKAFDFYTKASWKGHSDAQNMLGIMYFNGLGTEKNYYLARNWWEKSAAQGNKYAKKNLKLVQ